MAKSRSRPQSDRLKFPLNARQVEALDDMLEELYKAQRRSETALTTITTDTTLTGAGTTTSPLTVANPRQWTSVFKTANETRTTNNTTANDAALVVALAASKKYTVRLRVFYTAHTTPDFKYQMNFSGTTNRVTMVRHSVAPNTATFAVGIGEAFDAGDVAVVCVTGQDGWLYAEFSIDVANAGNFQFQWAQNTSDANATTVYAGSSIEYRQLD